MLGVRVIKRKATTKIPRVTRGGRSPTTEGATKNQC
jgi:hypothetical protein